MEKVSKEEFLSKCKKYHEIEERANIYPIARLLVNKGDVVGGVRLLLVSWNYGHIQRVLEKALRDNLNEKIMLMADCATDDELDLRARQTLEAIDRKWGEVNKKLADDIWKAWEEMEKEGDIEYLRGKRFEDLDLSGDSEDARIIDCIFRKWKDSVSYVGAAKALGLLFPSVFVMWDNSIARNYGIKSIAAAYQRLSDSSKPGISPYVEVFLRRVQERFKPLLDECPPQQLWEEHRLKLHEKDRLLYSKISFEETFPKMIDEFNYVESRPRDRRGTG
jgi:hypothetical protein